MSPAAAQQVDVIRGQITGTENEPLANVAVVVTSISGNVNRTARTDRAGRFTVTFPGGDGDYLVTVTALGYGVKRFELKRGADEDILIADAKLSRVGAVLDAVKPCAKHLGRTTLGPLTPRTVRASAEHRSVFGEPTIAVPHLVGTMFLATQP